MTYWLEARYAAFSRSYNHPSMMAASTPTAIALAAGTMVLVFATLGYVPAVAAASQLRHAWIALALTSLGAVSTYTAWRHECRGRIGTAASLLDNTLYLSAIAYAATHSAGGFGVGLAVVYAIALVGGTAQLYSLTLLLGGALVLPLAVVVSLGRFNPAVTLILIGSVAIGVAWAYMNGYRNRLLERQAELEHALGAADRLADESMEAALATTLLTLGHFLHELRNNQTVISANLAFLEKVSELGPQARKALCDAATAQAAEEELVRETIETLKQRAKPVSTTFLLGDLLGRVAAETEHLQVAVKGSGLRVEMSGNPEHLKLVLANLVRNATQSGAKRMEFELSPEPSGRAIRLGVHDDGPGVPPSRREALFRPFGETTTGGGTGLGLYLCWRHVSLMGGSIALEDGALGGASFIIRLPARILGSSPPPPLGAMAHPRAGSNGQASRPQP
jgi:signal transduction histidine kinase